MADNLKFGIGLDVDTRAFEDNWKKQEKEIQKIIDKTSFTINLGRVQGLEELIDKMKEIQNVEIKVKAPKGGGLSSMAEEAQVALDSIKGIREQLKDVEDQWNSLSRAEKFSNEEAGIYSETARELIAQHRELTSALDEYGESISRVSQKYDQFATSTAGYKSSLKALEQQWVNLTKEQKFTEKGDYTREAKDLISAYKEMRGQAEMYGETLGEIYKEQERLAETNERMASQAWGKQLVDDLTEVPIELQKMNAYYEQQERYWADFQKQLDQAIADEEELNRLIKEEADAREAARLAHGQESYRLNQQKEREAQLIQEEYDNLVKQIQAEQKLAIARKNQENQQQQALRNKRIADGKQIQKTLQAEEKTLKAINDKLAIQKQRLSEATIGSEKYNKIAAEIERLNDVLADYEASSGRGASNTAAMNSELMKQSGLLNGVQQFVNSYVSVLGAYRLVNNIRDITAEFELQRVSLRALTQDAEFANNLFERIKATAVQSPFAVKDMVTYTKQLAAYRIENEKLYDTMNMLADLSAGLGVSMDRLILAYGQVKAASVLRGQELRQFTEAGIPLVDELAKKFTELRGEVVKTGEVFELISKRQVSFDMVREVLEQMTEEGGRFYEMQKKQAESLYGVFENLKDNLQVGMNEVGEVYRDWFMGIGKGLTAIAKNIYEVISVVGSGIAVFVGYRTVLALNAKQMVQFNASAALTSKALSSIAAKQGAVTMTTKAAEKALKKATAQNNLYAIAMAKAALATNVFERAMFKLQAQFYLLKGAIASNPIGALITLLTTAAAAIAPFIRKAREAAKAQAEQNAKMVSAINGIQGYTSILTKLNAEEEDLYLRRKKLLDISQRTRYENGKLEAIENMLTESHMRRKEVISELSVLDEGFANQIRGISDDTDKLTAATNAYILSLQTRMVLEQLVKDEDLSKKAEDYNEALGKRTTIENKIITHADELVENLKRVRDGLNESSHGYGRLQEAIEMLEKAQQGGNDTFLETARIIAKTNESARSHSNLLKDLNKANTSSTKTEEKLAEAIDNVLSLLGNTPNIKNWLNELANPDIEDDMKINLRNSIRNAVSAVVDNIPFGEEIRKRMGKLFSGKFGFDFDVEPLPIKGLLNWQEDLQKLSSLDYATPNKQVETNFSNIVDEIKKKYKELSDEKKNVYAGLSAEQMATMGLTASYKTLTRQIQELQEYAAKYGIDLSTKQQGKDAKEALTSELNLIEQIYKRYKTLTKEMSDEAAVEKIKEIYQGLEGVGDIDFLSPETFKKRLAKILSKAKSLKLTDVVMSVGLKIQDVDFDELKRDLKGKLEKISADIESTKVASDIFENMFKLTGDIEISKKLTLSLTGISVDGTDMQSELAEQLATILSDASISAEVSANVNINKQAGESPEDYISRISSMIKQGQIGVEKINALIADLKSKDKELAGSLSSSLKAYTDYNKNILSDFFKTIDKTKDKSVKMDVLERQKTSRMGMKDMLISLRPEDVDIEKWTSWVDEYMAAVQREFDEGVAQLNFDAFKEKYSKQLADTEAASYEVLTRMQEELQRLMTMPGIADNAANLRAVQEILEKIGKTKIDKKPITELAKAFKKLKAAKDSGDAEAYSEALKKADLAVLSLQEQFRAVGQTIDTVIDTARDLAEAFGFSFGEDTEEAIDAFQSGIAIATAALSVMATVIAIIEAELTPLLIIALAVGAAFAAIKFISEADKKAAQKRIKALEKDLNSLKEKLKELEWQQDKLLSGEWVKNVVSQIKNIQKQIIDVNAQIKAELSQKSHHINQDAIADYEATIAELKRKQADLRASISEQVTGTSLVSAAQDFAQSWLDAYLSYSDTLQAMKDDFKNLMKSMIANSLLARVVQAKLKPLFDYIDNQLYDDEGNMVGSLEYVWTKFKELMRELPADLQATYEGLGEWAQELRDSGAGLKGIAKGVAQATEESVVTLAGYANSILYYHVKEATDLAAIRAILEGKAVVQPSVETEGGSVNISQLISLQQDTLANVILIKNDTGAIREDIADLKDSVRSVISGSAAPSPKTLNVRLRS